MSQPLANSYVITNTADPNTTIVEVLDLSQSGAGGTRYQTSFSGLKLVRRGARPYADIVSEDMLHMLENFKNSTAPTNPMVGQLWYNSSIPALQVCNAVTGSFPNITGTWNTLAASTDIVTGLPSNSTVTLVNYENHGVSGTASFSGGTATINTTLATTSVVPNTYSLATITVDAYGRVTAASSGSVAGLGYTPVNKAGDTITGNVVITGANHVLNVQSGKVQEGGNDLLPQGVITMWSGTIAPAGWALCDGTNGTPDLRDRFIVAAGSTMTAGSSGGSNTLSLTTSPAGQTPITVTIDTSGNHNHGGTAAATTLTEDQIPPHQHKSPYGEKSTFGSGPFGNDGTGSNHFGSNGGTDNDNLYYLTSSTGGGQSHDHVINDDGDHIHGATATTVPDHTHAIPSVDKRPAYYALAFIMKL